MTDVTADPTLNTVTWWEIPVQDLARAKDFYAAVFDWSYTSFGEGYEGILAGELMIGGLSQTGPDDPGGEGIRIYVQVDDMEGTFAKVEAHGGAVKTARTEIGGDMGWWGNFTDPDGRIIGVATNNPAS
jgi:predicted enzyme related to lactoylglutathione lyase